MYFISGIFSPSSNAIVNEPPPEKMPFSKTISYVLLSDIFLVQLFSSPQQQVASITKKEPIENWKLSLPSNDKTILDSVINPMAIHSFLDTFSLKNSNAINAVATISKLPRSDALDAVPIFIPIIKNIGAAISNPIIPIV